MFSFTSGMLAGLFLGINGTLLLLLLVEAIPDGYPAVARASKPRLITAVILVLIVLSGYVYEWLNLRRVAFPALIFLFLVFAAARTAGMLVSWLTLAFAAIVFAYVMVPAGSLRITDARDQVLLGLFIIFGIIGSRFAARRQES